ASSASPKRTCRRQTSPPSSCARASWADPTSMDNLEALGAALPQIGQGLVVTLTLTVGGALLAFVLAVALGLGARARNILVRGASRVVIEFFRGTSLVVQLFFLFFVLPQLGV